MRPMNWDTYTVEDNVRILGQGLKFIEILVSADDYVDTKLGFEDLGLFSIADDDGDIESVCARMFEKTLEDGTADVA